jgi:protocatechuate 3,4-dioxygenase alpha subunit
MAIERGITPSQTVGPFFHFALTPAGDRIDPLAGSDLSGPTVAGTPIRVVGRLTDGAGDPVPDGLIEIWQADGNGVMPGAGRSNSGFAGFGRAPTGPDGSFAFRTVRPGAVDGQAPHIVVGVFGRGLTRRLMTRLYFAGDSSNDRDPVLALVPPLRRATLLAEPEAGGDPPAWRFDIRLQGDRETVFFEA